MRIRRMKQILSIFLLLLNIGLLTFKLNLFDNNNPYHTLKNYAHVFAFLIITLTIYIILPESKYKIRFVGIIAVLLAFLTEIFQIYNSRDADAFDILLNCCGTGIVMLWILSKKASEKKYYKICLISLILLTISAFLYDFGSIEYTKYKFNKMLPILSDFENEWELERWQCNGDTEIIFSNDFSTHGKSCIKIKFDTSIYPGIRLRYVTKDWSRYKNFSFDIFNPQKEVFKLLLRFDCSHSIGYTSRGHIKIKIFPGKNIVKIPIENIEKSPSDTSLNMQEMMAVIFFLYKPQKNLSLFLDYVRFEY